MPPHCGDRLWLGLITPPDYSFLLAMNSHALMHARRIETEEIVLHPFGGPARLKTQPQNPRAEFRIAFAGPAASSRLPCSLLPAPNRAVGNYEARWWSSS